MMKKKKQRTKVNNFVAKHAQSTGSGTHEEKEGDKSKRCRQKRKWKKDVKAAETQLSF